MLGLGDIVSILIYLSTSILQLTVPQCCGHTLGFHPHYRTGLEFYIFTDNKQLCRSLLILRVSYNDIVILG